MEKHGVDPSYTYFHDQAVRTFYSKRINSSARESTTAGMAQPSSYQIPRSSFSQPAASPVSPSPRGSSFRPLLASSSLSVPAVSAQSVSTSRVPNYDPCVVRKSKWVEVNDRTLAIPDAFLKTDTKFMEERTLMTANTIPDDLNKPFGFLNIMGSYFNCGTSKAEAIQTRVETPAICSASSTLWRSSKGHSAWKVTMINAGF